MTDQDEGTFDSLMSRLGVRKLGQPDRPRGRTRAGRQGRAGGEPRSVAPEPRAQPEAAATTPDSLPPEPRSPDPPAAAELEAARVAAQAAEARVRTLELRVAELTAGLSEAQELAAERERRRVALRRALDRSLGHDTQGATDLGESLQARGLLGVDEHAAALAALAAARLAGPLTARLEAIDSDDLAGFLAERLHLQGGCAACPAAPGRAVVAVAPSRCEVCAGHDLMASVRTFVDALLVNGLTRVLVVGGTPLAARQVRGLVSHNALVVDVAARLPDDPRARRDVSRDRQLLVLWGEAGANLSDDDVAALGLRVSRVPAGPLGSMLRSVGRALMG